MDTKANKAESDAVTAPENQEKASVRNAQGTEYKYIYGAGNPLIPPPPAPPSLAKSFFTTNSTDFTDLQRIVYSPPPWAGAPPQLTLQLQEALHQHVSTRPPLNQYFNMRIPAYCRDYLLLPLSSMLQTSFPPTFYEISTRLLLFYLEVLCPYIINHIDPHLLNLTMVDSDVQTTIKNWDLPADFTIQHDYSQAIKQDFLTMIGPRHLIQRYQRRLLRPRQERILIFIMEVTMDRLRSKMQAGARVAEMAIEIGRSNECLEMFSTTRSERIERMMVKYLEEEGFNQAVFEAVEAESVTFTMYLDDLMRRRREDIGAIKELSTLLRQPDGWTFEKEALAEVAEHERARAGAGGA